MSLTLFTNVLQWCTCVYESFWIRAWNFPCPLKMPHLPTLHLITFPFVTSSRITFSVNFTNFVVHHPFPWINIRILYYFQQTSKFHYFRFPLWFQDWIFQLRSPKLFLKALQVYVECAFTIRTNIFWHLTGQSFLDYLHKLRYH